MRLLALLPWGVRPVCPAGTLRQPFHAPATLSPIRHGILAPLAHRTACPPLSPSPPAACDVMEDVAIAYGYNNLTRTVPKTVTAGRELPLNQLCELLRGEAAMAGFTEVLTWALCSHAENFEQLRRVRWGVPLGDAPAWRQLAEPWPGALACACHVPPAHFPCCTAPIAPQPDDGTTAATIGNPATAEFEVCRTSLLPGALKTLGARRGGGGRRRSAGVHAVPLRAPRLHVHAHTTLLPSLPHRTHPSCHPAAPQALTGTPRCQCGCLRCLTSSC